MSDRDLSVYEKGLVRLIRDLTEQAKTRGDFKHLNLKLRVHANGERLFSVRLTRRQHRWLANRRPINRVSARYDWDKCGNH